MATYTPALYPRRPKNSNPLAELRYELQLAYYRYELNTGQYVMSPAEKAAYNLIVLSILGMLFMAVYYYLPTSLTQIANRLVYYLTGSLKAHTPALDVAAAPILQNSGEAAATLAGSARMVANGTMTLP